MSWEENINNIKEVYKGHYQIILDFATTQLLPHLLRDDYEYVWVCDHGNRNSTEWNEYELPLFNNQQNIKVLGRQLNFDYALPTVQFKELLPQLYPGIHLIQLNKLPSHYLSPQTIKGKTFYDLLQKECDYLFEVNMPNATDYGTLRSSNRDYLQSLLDSQTIDWKNLP